jgi:DNA primase catalytic core
MMSLHKLTAGDGYTYLTRQVAAFDATERGYKSLNDYYSAKGESPGRWMGRGLAGLDMVPGGEVTEQQMKALFGEGRHPNSATIQAAILAAPDGAVLGDRVKAVDKATRLGRLYPTFEGTSEFRAQLGEAYQAFNTVRGLAKNAQIEEADRARIRTDVAATMFAAEHHRPPASEQEFSSFLARISRPVSSAVAGYDLTFSPVKSFSTLWALSDRAEAKVMEDALYAAIEHTSAWAEDNIVYTRIGPNGIQRVPVHGLVVAAFLHRDSRAGEPNVHVHWTVSGKVQAQDGQWKALDGTVLHKYAVAMSEHFNAQLEAEHIARVPHIRYETVAGKDSKRPTREIVGVNITLTKTTFSSRRIQIEAALTRLASRFSAEHGRVPTTVEQFKLAQQANLDTRAAKHEPRSEAEQRQSWRAQAAAAIGEPGLRQMRGAVRAGAARSWRPVTTQLIDQLVATTAQVVAEERATWQHNHVLAESIRQAKEGGLDPQLVNQLAEQVCDRVLADSVPLGPGPDLPIELTPPPLHPAPGFAERGRQLYTSTVVLAAENRIVAAAGRLDGRVTSDLDIALAHAEWSANHDGRTLNTAQKQLVRAIATEGRRVGLALAPAGTGKTTALGVLASAWRNSGGKVVGLAPSAAAARALRQALNGVQADTLHKLVWEIKRTDPAKWSAWIKDIDSTTLLLIDEAGLAGTPLLDAAIEFTLSRGGRVQLVGDDRQHAASGAGGILRNIAAEHGALTLDEVLRFHDDAEKAASLALREGDATALGYYLDHRRLHAATLDTIADVVYEAWAADIAAGKPSMMTAPTLEQVALLNARARADRLALADTNPGRQVTVAGGEQVSAGDSIISKNNDRRLSLGGTDFVKNGDRWHVSKVHRGGALTVTHLVRGTTIRLPAEYVAQWVRLGYADTAVSVQGRTVGNARVEGTCHNIVAPRTDRNSFYTIMTRGTAGNHAYLPLGSSDEHAITHREAMAPATIAEMAIAILARDGSPRSATTELHQAGDPHVTLGRFADGYQHAIDTAAQDILGKHRVDQLKALAEQAIPGITNEGGAWDTLQAHLATLALGGRDPIQALLTAAASRELGNARDTAAVLDWRLDPTGRHSQHPGPLPWLPAPAPTIEADPTWQPYLDARAQLVADAAATVTADVATWTPATAPAWALPYLSDPQLVADLGLWRAARSVPGEDLRPAGPRPYALALAHRHDELLQRSLRHAGDAGDGAARWAATLTQLGARIGGDADPQWPLMAARLTLAETAGLPVARLLAAAIAVGPLPAEHPSSALWWRLESHLSPAMAAQPYGSHQLRPAWTSQLPGVLGDELADRITNDRLWPAIVARMDTAIRDGADADQLAHDAAALLAGGLDGLSPDQLATVLLWQISMLDDPPPAEYEPAFPDPDEAAQAAPADAHLIDPPGDHQVVSDHAEVDRLDEPVPDRDYDDAPADLLEVLQEAFLADEQAAVADLVDQPGRPVLIPVPPALDVAPLLAAVSDAAEFYQASAADSWVPSYLRGRGLHELAESTRAGYAPAGWTNLVEHMRALGHTDQVLLDAGLARMSSRDSLIDAYRDRLILPITTPAGDVVSFIGRANPTAGPNVPKYINGPSTPIYNKSELPYGLDPAAVQQLRAGAPLVIVEGPMDAEAIRVAATNGGLHIVPVAAAGTALTDGHLRSINNIVQLEDHQVITGFDADTAGRRATLRANQLLDQLGDANPLQMLPLPAGADPARILEDHGPANLALLLQHTTPALDLVVDEAMRPWLDAAGRESAEPNRQHILGFAITPAITAASTNPDGSLRDGLAIYRQFERIAEALDRPVSQILDLGLWQLFDDNSPTWAADRAPLTAAELTDTAKHAGTYQETSYSLLLDSGMDLAQPTETTGLEPATTDPTLGL